MTDYEENVVAGIDEEELGALGLEVLDSMGRISEIFDRMDSSMEKLPSIYKGDPCKKIIERYNSLRAFFPDIKENIKSYSDDFIMLTHKMRENDKYLSSLFENLTSDVNNQIKADNFKI